MKLPDWLASWAVVETSLAAAPLDRPARLETIYRILRQAGWQVAVTNVGTDVPTAFGVPLPSSQPVTFLLKRPGVFRADDAAAAVRTALAAVREERSAVTAWIHELGTEVAKPTVDTVVSGAKSFGALAGVALLAYAIGRLN